MQVIQLDPGTYQPPGAALGQGLQSGMNMVFKAKLDEMAGQKDRDAMAALGQLWNQDQQAYNSWSTNRPQAEATAKAFEDHVKQTGGSGATVDDSGPGGTPSIQFDAKSFMDKYDSQMPKANVQKVMQIAKTGSGAFNMAQELYPELFGGSRFYQDVDGNVTNKPGPGTTLLQPNMARDILKEQNKAQRPGRAETYAPLGADGKPDFSDASKVQSFAPGDTIPKGYIKLSDYAKLQQGEGAKARGTASQAAASSKATTAAIGEARKISLSEIGVTSSPALEKALGDPNANNQAIMSSVNGSPSLLSLTMAKHLANNPDPGAKTAAEGYRKEGLESVEGDLADLSKTANFKQGGQLLRLAQQSGMEKGKLAALQKSYYAAQAATLRGAATKFAPKAGEDPISFKQRFYKEAKAKGIDLNEVGDTSEVDAALEQRFPKG